MTPARFLLERISERESLARDVRHQAAQGNPMLHVVAGGTLVRDLVDPDQITSECAAQREVVYLLSDVDAPDIHGDAWAAVKTAIRHLATPYDWHPDWREEWRP